MAQRQGKVERVRLNDGSDWLIASLFMETLSLFARREFWRRITALAEQGVTAIVTTHFLEEAEYCDRIAIMDGGRVLAQGTPAEVRRHAHTVPGRAPTMEDAFIAIVEEARQAEAAASARRAGGAA